ncbi:hypothetical protein GALMADRAFT_229125 [Galerina marginata CBS 339.88]|uniref:Uncharacterized protein n=1 Tax=Galerina marginata (strain CBS 339.88) TaxID=685588 RepID=A0A067SN27_GALM3|nr:hypothetical protein GALMADRAFT_229125 [Galerina marginata CBS 339.88]
MECASRLYIEFKFELTKTEMPRLQLFDGVFELTREGRTLSPWHGTLYHFGFGHNTPRNGDSFILICLRRIMPTPLVIVQSHRVLIPPSEFILGSRSDDLRSP